MNKQDYPKQIFKLLKLEWEHEIHTSKGGTVTAKAWEEVYNKLEQWDRTGILSIVEGLEALLEASKTSAPK
jgi:hypothetical protein